MLSHDKVLKAKERLAKSNVIYFECSIQMANDFLLACFYKIIQADELISLDHQHDGEQ